MRLLATYAWLGLGLGTLHGCVVGAGTPPSQAELAKGPPPAPVEAEPSEAEPTSEHAGEEWVPGYWHYNGARNVWIPGRWQKRYPAYTWLPR